MVMMGMRWGWDLTVHLKLISMLMLRWWWGEVGCGGMLQFNWSWSQSQCWCYCDCGVWWDVQLKLIFMLMLRWWWGWGWGVLMMGLRMMGSWPLYSCLPPEQEGSAIQWMCGNVHVLVCLALPLGESCQPACGTRQAVVTSYERAEKDKAYGVGPGAT
jgi:hypothetical protein